MLLWQTRVVYSQRNHKPVNRDDHQIRDGTIGSERSPQRIHLTGDFTKQPFGVDAEQRVDPRHPEQQPEIGHGQRPNEYRHGLMLWRLEEFPDDDRQHNAVAGDADDEDHPVEDCTRVLGHRRAVDRGQRQRCDRGRVFVRRPVTGRAVNSVILPAVGLHVNSSLQHQIVMKTVSKYRIPAINVTHYRITDRSFRWYASPRLWNQLPESFRQPN